MSAMPPLLMLAEGRKPRPRKAIHDRPKEIALHMAVAKVLREHCLPKWQWTHLPACEVRDMRTATKLKRMGTKAGWPDIVLAPPTGQLHCLELKRQRETFSDAQEDFRLWWCVCNGVPHSVAHSFDDALAALTHWGCLRTWRMRILS